MSTTLWPIWVIGGDSSSSQLDVLVRAADVQLFPQIAFLVSCLLPIIQSCSRSDFIPCSRSLGVFWRLYLHTRMSPTRHHSMGGNHLQCRVPRLNTNIQNFLGNWYHAWLNRNRQDQECSDGNDSDTIFSDSDSENSCSTASDLDEARMVKRPMEGH